MEHHDCDVAVIGGGLAGVTAALAFAEQGCTVRLFERRDLARDPNRGDILHPPTVKVISALGLLDRIDARGATRLQGVEIVSPDATLATQPHPGEEYRILNHAQMEAVIMEAAEAAGAVVQSEGVRTLARDGDAPDAGWVLTSDHFTRARFVVGADGADSLTRRTLGIEHDDVHEYDHWLVVLHADRPDWLAPEWGWTLYHPEGAIFILPTTPVGRIRLIMTVPRDEAKEWMTSSEDELARRLGARHPKLQGLHITKRGGSHVYRLKRTHAATYVGPHAALVGDAVHTTHTMGGQGLNMAIQDAAKVAELVGPVLTDPSATDDALRAALAEYESIRMPIDRNTLAVAHEASRMAEPGPAGYEAALAFYRHAADDPEYLTRFAQRFGGRA